MFNKNDKPEDFLAFSFGNVFCSLAICSILIDKGLVARNELLDMLDLFIDWTSQNAGTTESMALKALRDQIENILSDELSIKEVLSFSLYRLPPAT